MVDGLIVVHDLDAKSTQVYDPKLPYFSEPLLYGRLVVDQRHVESKFLSDIFLNEEVFQYQQAMKDQRLPFEEKKVDFNIAYSQEPN